MRFPSSMFARLIFGTSLVLLTAACGPDDDNNSTVNNTMMQPMDMGTDQGDVTDGGVTDGGVTDAGVTDGGVTDLGDDMGTQGPDVSTPALLGAALETATAQAFCRAVWECPEQSGDLVLVLGGAKDQEDCIARLAGIDDSSVNLIDAVAKGRVTYDAVKAKQCFEEFSAMLERPACELVDLIETSEAEPASCLETFVGAVAEDDNCVEDDDCSGTLACDFNTNDDADQCYATCQQQPCNGLCNDNEYCEEGDVDLCIQRLADGQECFDDYECQQESYCDLDLDSPVCTPNTDEFENLALNDAGVACNVLGKTWCKPGLTCTEIELPSFDGVCGVASAVGASCVFDFSCETGLYCDGVDFATFTLGACTLAKADGAACDSDSQCQSFACNNSVCGAAIACMLP